MTPIVLWRRVTASLSSLDFARDALSLPKGRPAAPARPKASRYQNA
jgi:hypothetical protein